MMRIFVPANIDFHPYLILLYSYLNKYVQVIDVKSKKDFLYKLKYIINTDIIHLHWIENFIIGKDFILTFLKLNLFLIFLVVLKFFRKSIVVTLHNIMPHERRYVTLTTLGFKISLHYADAIIVHNRWSKKEAERIYGIKGGKIYVIPHGNFIGYYPNKIPKDTARTLLSIPKDCFAITYIGKIKKYKGLNKLISALADFNVNDLWLLICGKVEDEKIRETIERFSKNFKNCVRRLEYVSDEDIQIYINASDVGVLPYEEITTSGVLFLFASFGKTVITPDLEPIRETFRDALIYYNGSIEGLKSTIKELLDGKYELDKLSQRIYNIARSNNWEEIALKLKDVYYKVKRGKIY